MLLTVAFFIHIGYVVVRNWNVKYIYFHDRVDILDNRLEYD